MPPADSSSNAAGAASSPRVEVGGDGFYLSRYDGADKTALLAHLADPEIARNTLAIPHPYTEADAEWWIAHCAQRAREPEILFALREPGGGLIGSIGVVGELAADDFRAEIGYWLGASWRGRGLMARAVRAYANYAFTQLGLRRLYAMPFGHNLASARTLENAGFIREGCLRRHYRKNGQYLDAIVYGLLRPE